MPEIPDKYRNPDGTPNVDAMLESISYFERRQGEQSGGRPQAPPQAPQAQNGLSAEAMRPYLLEYAQTGTLSPWSAQAIEKLYGYPATMAETLVAGQVAQAKNRQAEVLRNTGLDEDGFKTLHSWGQASLTPQQKAALDAQFRSDDPSIVTQAVQWLKSQHDAAQAGPAGHQILGQNRGTPAPPAEPEMTAFEMQEAMRNPLYATDEDYTKEVDRRVMASTKLDKTLEVKNADQGNAGFSR